jgi:hypothetical protein
MDRGSRSHPPHSTTRSLILESLEDRFLLATAGSFLSASIVLAPHLEVSVRLPAGETSVMPAETALIAKKVDTALNIAESKSAAVLAKVAAALSKHPPGTDLDHLAALVAAETRAILARDPALPTAPILDALARRAEQFIEARWWALGAAVSDMFLHGREEPAAEERDAAAEVRIDTELAAAPPIAPSATTALPEGERWAAGTIGGRALVLADAAVKGLELTAEAALVLDTASEVAVVSAIRALALPSGQDLLDLPGQIVAPLQAALPTDLSVLENAADAFFVHLDKLSEPNDGWRVPTRFIPWAVAMAAAAVECARRWEKKAAQAGHECGVAPKLAGLHQGDEA